jgi:tRNA (cytidine/uridine-2'-O-)-methyltransferase
MFHIVLFEPTLHLIHPLGFDIDDKQLRRAGLDYREFANILQYNNFDEYINQQCPDVLYAASTKGKVSYTDIKYCPGDNILFGPESRGLPNIILNSLGEKKILRIPMQANSRSLNLSNSVAVILYEALRQNNFRFDSSKVTDN